MILKKGDKGSLVVKLQEKLGIEADGDFGNNTDKALRDFQSKNNLTVDGIAGNATYELLGLDLGRYIKNGNNSEVSWELPDGGVGFRTYNRELRGDQFGTRKCILTLIEIAKQWNEIHPEIDIQFGDISRVYGGDTPSHATHERGTDADMRPFRKDGKYVPVVYTDPNYSQSLTRDFLKLIKGKVKGVYFNDPVLIKEGLCKHCAGHSDHLHLMI